MNRITLAAGLAALTAGAAGCGGNQPGPPPQPPSVHQVAAQTGAKRLSDCGPAPGGGVSDSAVAYRGATRVGIDTFPTQAVRDKWIKTAQGYGVVVLAEGSTWVLYRAVNQRGKGCGG